jgi:hypothetical protein
MFYLKEESLVSYADVDRRLVVILALQESVRILCLNGYLGHRIVVYTHCHALNICIIVGSALSITGIGIIGFVTAKDIQLLAVGF